MPKVTFEKLAYPSISPTTMCVQLADSTIRYPKGVVERLMVKVKNTYILVDFVFLDMEGDLGIPLILGDHSSRIQTPELMWGQEESASVSWERP